MTVKYKSSLEQRVVNDTTYGRTWDSAPASATALVTQTLCVCVWWHFLCEHETEQQPQRQ
jgi:hypothetical protein